METVVLVIHLLIAIGLVGTILLQKSEGGALGMGGGGSGGMGGFMSGRAAGDFLTRTTAILAACFFLTSFALAILSGAGNEATSILDQAPTTPTIPETPTAPKIPGTN